MGKDSERRSLSSSLREHIFPSSDPPWVDELRKDELKKLTEIFHLGKAGSRNTEEIRRLIKELPKAMRRERMSRTNDQLCDAHQGLNYDLAYDLYRLVQREVSNHLSKYERYPELQKPIDAVIIKRLQAMRGMWIKYDKREAEFETSWRFEGSRCCGCMVGRVATDRDALRNLRIALLARTQTRKHHVPRRLMSFVDGCINRFPDDLTEMYDTSSQFGYIMKATRRACTKRLYVEEGIRPHQPKSRYHRDRDASSSDRPRNEARSGSESSSSKRPAQGPRSIHEPHPADRLVPEPLRPRSNSRTDTDEGRSGSQTGSKKSMDSSNSSHLRKFVLNSQASAASDNGSEKAARLTEFIGRRIDSLQDSYYPPGGESSSRPSAASGAVDAVDEMTDMYRNMGTNPYRDYHLDDSDEEEESDDEEEGPSHPHSPANLAAAMDAWSVLGHKGDD